MKRKNLTMTFIFITVVLNASGYGIIAPVLPSLIQEVSGEGLSQAARIGGYMTFAFGFMQFICGPIIGNLSDAYGRRVVLLISLLGLVVDYIILALAPSVAWLIIGRILGGATSATQATANAVVTDTFTGQEKARNFGLLGAAFGLGFILGPVIGAGLSLLGTRAPFWGAAVIAFANFGFGFFFFKETLKPENRRDFSWKRSNAIGALMRLKNHPSLALFAWIFFFTGIASTVFPSIWTFFVEYRYNFEPWLVGASLTLFGISTALSQAFLVRPAIKKFGAQKLVSIIMFTQIFVFIGIALIQSVWVVALLLTFCGVLAIIRPTLQSIVTRFVKVNEQGELQGILASIQSLTSLIGTLVMTQSFAWFTDDKGVKFDGAPFIISSISVAIAFLLFKKLQKNGEFQLKMEQSQEETASPAPQNMSPESAR